jgi:hypothetical protein
MTFNSGATTLRFAGDVNIDKCVITSINGVFQDITAQVLRVQVFEDIFAPFISGSIIVKDALDFTNIFPLKGEEYLKLKITTPTLPRGNIEGDFHVYKMSDRTKLGDSVAAYELNFISIEAVSDTNKKISKVYAGKISDVVGSFVIDKIDGLESNKNFTVENTRNTIKYISNFWSPVKNLSFLAENAISESQSPSFLFFENRDGFNFRSLEKLYKGDPIIEFVNDRYTRDNFPVGGNALNILEDFKRITDLEIPTTYDAMDRTRSGMMASKLMSYDSTKKTYTVRNYNASNRFDSQIHLNPKPLFSKNAPIRTNALQILYPRAFETFTSFGDTTNAKIIQERISFLKMAEGQKMMITVPGRCDYTVGMVCTVRLQQTKPILKRDTQSDITDKVLSGKYLISAINHIITPEGHECHMELSKDSLM